MFEVETGKHNFLVAGTMNFEYLDFAFPQIITDELPDGTQNEEYSATLAATGITPITWSIKNGQLPDGLSINPETGEISGTPTEDGTFEFTVRAENEAGYDEKDFSIFIVKVGINGTEISGIRIYPNPTAGELRITNYELKGISEGELQITNYELKGISVIDIFDVIGRNVFNTKTQRREVSNCEIVLDISDLPAGVYFLRVGNEMVKVVKK